MKKANRKQTILLKGISTLDVMRRNAKIMWLFLILTALNGAIYGGHSILDLVDPSFNPQIQTMAATCKYVDQIVPLPHGKMLVAGQFNSYDYQPVGGLVRLNADGTLDPTFNSTLPSRSVKNMVVLADGRIVVITYPNDMGQNQMIRLNADGTNDPTLGTDSGYLDGTLAIDAGGRMIVGGSFNSPNGNRSIVRLNPNGTRDQTFDFPLENIFIVRALSIQNNKIIAAYVGGEPFGATIQRLNENGTIDSSFIARNFLASSVIVQPDGKILIHGSSDLRRLNQDGSDDTGFATLTFPLTTGVQRMMALSNDGKITVANRINDFGVYRIRRFLADGTEDSSFTPYTAARFASLALQADGSVLIGDGCSNSPLTNDFVRLFLNGNLDPTFNTGIGFQSFAPSSVTAINIQPDGKILIGGDFHLVNDVPRYKIARMNADSTLDTSFQINTSGSGNYFNNITSIHTIRTQSDGKIVVSGGFFYFVNGEFKANLVRLNSDGSIDTTFILSYLRFDPGFEIFNDGKLLLNASRASNESYPVPVKLTATGELDTTFNPNLYPQASVVASDVAIQPDGKILVGGSHSRHDSETNTTIFKSFLTRLNADGSLDTTFQSYEQLDRTGVTFVLQPNGKIVIAHSTFWTEPSQNGSVLRLNSDGSVDPTFNAGTGANGKVNTMLLLPTGRIFVGGRFTNFNGQPRTNLVQLNADGSVFTPLYDLNDEVFCLAVDSIGRVLVGGNFTVIVAGNSSAPRSYVARLVDESPSSTRFDFNGDGLADLGVYLAADGMWSTLNSVNYQTVSTRFGQSEDKTVAADFDGDLKTDYAVFRPSNGTWYVKESTIQTPNAFREVRWGSAEDKPIAGDFDGDGKADFAIWRPSSAVWWIQKSSNSESTVVAFGLPGDVPLCYADFDGDRKTDIAVWRPSDGNFYWLASGSGNQFNAVHFGQNGDIPAVGDFNGDGKTDLVVYRPAEGIWYQNLSMPSGDYTFAVTYFGLNGDEPVAADYDGDGKTDIAIRRQSAWHILNSTQGYMVHTFGNANARAVAALPIQ